MDIQRLTKTKDDTAAILQYTKQSHGPGDYATTYLVPDARKVNPFSVENYMMYAREGYGLNNKAVDADSVLKNQQGFTNRKCNIRAQERPFLSVPFMGGGRGNQQVETYLQHAEMSRQGKACDTVTETFFTQQYTPLVPSLAQNIQNPRNLVPEVAASGWIRGGLPSREYLRDMQC